MVGNTPSSIIPLDWKVSMTLDMEDLCYDSDNSIEISIKTLMTIIVALKESDTSILLATDSEVSEEGGLRLTKQKLREHRARPIAWGFGGDNVIHTEEFTQWLQSGERPKEWLPFAKEAIEEFAKLNGRLIQLVKLTQRNPTERDMVICLLAGWLDGPNIIELNERGKATSYWESGFHAIGGGKVPAYTAYKVISHIGGYTPLDTLDMVMDIVTTLVDKCSKPYCIWRITPENITELKGISSGEDKK